MRAQELRETVSNEKRQAINAQSKVQAHSSKECCRRKAIIRTYSEFVSVAIFSSMQSERAALYCHLWSE
jgi:hypothetical protein